MPRQIWSGEEPIEVGGLVHVEPLQPYLDSHAAGADRSRRSFKGFPP